MCFQIKSWTTVITVSILKMSWFTCLRA